MGGADGGTGPPCPPPPLPTSLLESPVSSPVDALTRILFCNEGTKCKGIDAFLRGYIRYFREETLAVT
jgi:hypothetical protein